MVTDKKTNAKNSLFNKFLNGVEVVGNKLPHPITLFALFCLAIIVISAICAAIGVSATGELVKAGKLEMQTITAVSLLSGKGIAYMLTSAVTNFTSFAPLGVVLVAMLGVGCAEGSGYISTILKRAVAVTPKGIITPMIVFLGVMSNIASDAGYVVLIPIGALVFMACGRHPLAGLAAAFAGVSGGFSANLLIGTLDPLLAGISTEAAKMIDPTYVVGATGNMFFMIVSTFLITILGTFVTNKIVEPRLGKYKGHYNASDSSSFTEVTKQERKALTRANLTLLAMIIGLVVILIPQDSFLRAPETGSIIAKSPFMGGIVVIIAIMFFIPALVYGFSAGKYKSDKDVGAQLGKNMASMGSYIALVFIAAQFVNYFSYTNLGTILALKGAEFLKSTGISGIGLMLSFIVLSAFINLFMGSASAKWAIMAPVFVPMFMALGYAPELTQIAYRIGDSTTNIISPLMSYFAMIVVFAKQYDEDSGIGTLIATMLPYTFFFLIGWAILLMAWMSFGLPLGPGVGLLLG